MDIFEASQDGHLHIVDSLIESGIDPSNNNNLSIILASQNGYIKIVNRLLEDSRVNPNSDNNDAIRLASKNGHIKIVNRLLEDPRVYNDENIRKKFWVELKNMELIRNEIRNIMDINNIPEDLIYVICKYIYYSTNMY